MILSFKNVDEILYLYIKDYNKKLVFNNKDCKYLMTDMIKNTINISLSNYLRDAIDNLYFYKCICIKIYTLTHIHVIIFSIHTYIYV